MMELVVILPTGVVLRRRVSRVVAPGLHGRFGMLPLHLDAVAGLKPGILLYETDEGEGYLAIDEGCLTKKERLITVVTLRAYQASSLEELASQVKALIHGQDEDERRTRSALAGMETRIARGLASLEKKRGR